MLPGASAYAQGTDAEQHSIYYLLPTV